MVLTVYGRVGFVGRNAGQRRWRRIAFGPQVAFDLLHHRPQARPQAQRYAGGQDVDDGQVQQTRDHRAVAVKVFGMVGREQSDLEFHMAEVSPDLFGQDAIPQKERG